ncbi:hypothetical protein M3Y96_01237800 [Aphelenchoides besseyi]|nr:hypothetical protein M3Y96_01237800 [Aphelenchoides besseyi]
MRLSHRMARLLGVETLKRKGKRGKRKHRDSDREALLSQEWNVTHADNPPTDNKRRTRRFLLEFVSSLENTRWKRTKIDEMKLLRIGNQRKINASCPHQQS